MKRLSKFLLSFALAIPGLAPAVEPAGALDPTFGSAGIRTLGFDVPGGDKHDDATALAKAPDGRLFLVGAVTVSAQFQYEIGITRLSPDGVVDQAFGVGGRVRYSDPLLKGSYVLDAAFQPDGKLVVAGGAYDTAEQKPGMLVCRFDLDGGIDPGFGGIGASPGCVFAKISENAAAYALAIQADGRIVVAGRTLVGGKPRALLARLRADGSLDDSLGGSGFRLPFPNTDSMFRDVAVAPDDKLVAVGEYVVFGNANFVVAQFKASNGVLDPEFSGGYKNIAFDLGGDKIDSAAAVRVNALGTAYVTGHVQTGATTYSPAVVVVKKDGALEGSFAGGGKKVYDSCVFVVGGCDERANDLALLDDGKIVLAGSSQKPGNPGVSKMLALRLGADGSRDGTFGSNVLGQEGASYIDVSPGADLAYRIATQGKRVLLAGAATPSAQTQTDFAMVRLDHGDATSFVVTPKPGPNGSLSPAVAQLVPHSAHVQFTVTPKPGHAIKSVTSNCGGALIGKVFTTAPIVANCTVNALFAADVTLNYYAGEHGTLQGDVQQISQIVPYGGSGTPVGAIADTGYAFDRWSDGVVENPRQDVGVTEGLGVTAQFVISKYKVFGVAAQGGGQVAPSDGMQVPHGGHGAFTILPDPGFGVAGVSGCEGILVGDTYYTGVITQDCSFAVDFVPSGALYGLTYKAGPQCEIAGAIDGVLTQKVASGHDGAAVVASAKPGHVFVQWSDGVATAERKDVHVFDHLEATAQCAPIDAAIHAVVPTYDYGGVLAPLGPQQIASGGSAQFQVLPKPGYTIHEISGCNGGALQGNVYTTAPISADCEVHAAFVASNAQYQLRYAAGSGGMVDGALAQTVISGGSGTAVAAIAHPGHFFVQWSDGSTHNPRQDKNVMADVDVVAQFAAEGQLTVTPSAGAGGSIAPDLVQVVAPGAVLQFTVTPDPLFGIVEVSGCGGALQGKLYTTAPIQASCHVQAHFAGSNASYWLTYAAGAHGSLEGQLVQQVKSGESGSSVLAKPDPGHQFLQWSDGSTQNPRTDAGVVADVDVTAQFVASGSLIVTPTAGAGGSIVPGIKQVASAGQVLQFEVLPDAGFAVAAVGGDCGGSLQGTVYTTAPIAASCSVQASFAPSAATYSLKYVAGPNGKIDGQAEVSQQVISGASGTAVEAQPAAGHYFVQWSDGSTANPRTDAHVVADLEVTAQFAQNGSFVVKPVAGPGGSLSPALAQVVAPGGVVQFGVHPDDGFLIGMVSGCGGALVGNTYVTAPIQANCEVHASFVASDQQFQLTYLAGPNGSVVGAVQQSVAAGADGEPVTAVPADGYFFVKWSDGWTGSERTDTDVSADLTVTADFAPTGTPVHTVTPIAGSGGAFWPDGPQSVVDGANAVFTVKPNPGFAIDEVVGCGGTLIGNQYVTAPALADCDVQASFVASAETFLLTYRAGANGLVNGQAEVSTTVSAGATGILVSAQPAAGFVFVQWSDGSVANPRLDGNVAADIDVTAEFAAAGTTIHEVVPLSGEGGALAPPVPQHVAHGDTAVFEVVPNEGYAIASIGGSCGGSLVGNQYVTAPVTAHCTVEASFVPSAQVFSLVYNAGPNGRVNGQTAVAQNVAAGGAGPLVQAQPDAGHQFIQWSDGMLGNPRQDTNVAANLEVTAQFAPVGATLYTVVPTASAGGGISPAVPMQVVAGETAAFTLLPNPGYGIQSVASSCGGQLVGNVFTTAPVHANCTVEAAFFDDRIFASGFESGL